MLKEWIAIGTKCIETGSIDLDRWQSVVRARTDPRVEPYLGEIRQWSLIMMYRDRGAQQGKPNCWEVMKCGMTGEGIRGWLRGTCPARIEARLDGIHGGMNAGRSCWTVENTLCAIAQRQRAVKDVSCASCRFFRQVHAEERQDLMVSDAFLSNLLR